jgi:hypothetical protein
VAITSRLGADQGVVDHHHRLILFFLYVNSSERAGREAAGADVGLLVVASKDDDVARRYGIGPEIRPTRAPEPCFTRLLALRSCSS